jgi:FkbM family methyltransferase
MSYSYDQDDEAITGYFKAFKGRFLDIGAHDGKTRSNTYWLAELGWSGVCVEPSWRPMQALIANHKKHPNVAIVNAAMDDKSGVFPFWDCAADSMISTMNKEWQDRTPERIGAIKIFVCAFTIHDLLKAFPGDFHCISIDAEGLSIRIMKSLPLKAMNTRLICVERLSKEEEPEIVSHCSALGYRLIFKNGENVIMAL